MDNSSSSDTNVAVKLPIKTVFTVGGVTLIPLEKSIVERLGIEDNTIFQEEVVRDGILLRLVHKNFDSK